MNRIEIKNLTKKFRIGYDKNHTALSRILNAISGKEPQKELIALENISLKIKPGRGIGIIGRNGSGKSTLLRIIAGIYKEDTGSINTSGKLVSLVSLSLHDRLSMRDNIYLACTLYGLDKKTIKKRFESIVKFAGLEEFIDTKLHQFSTGMIHRLVTAIVIYSGGEIILLDDVDSVTDKSFTDKFMKKGREMIKNQNTTILMVSHNLELLKRVDEIIWIDEGKIKMYGEKSKVIKSYLRNIKNEETK